MRASGRTWMAMALAVLAAACGSEPRVALDTLVVRDSVYVDAGTGAPYTGRVYRLFPEAEGEEEGRVQLEGRLEGGTWSGELTVYHPGGSIRYQGRLADGAPCGAWVENRDEEREGSVFDQLVRDIESMGIYPPCPGDEGAGETGAGTDGDAARARTGGAVAPRALEDPAWRVQHRDPDALFVGLHAVDSLTVWVAGHGGRVGRTVDGGDTWEMGVVPGADSLGFRDVHAFSAREAVVLSIGEGEASRIYRTEDGGVSWTETFRNTDPAAFFDCLSFWDGERGFAFSDAVDGEFVLIRTGDGGRSWSRIDPARVPDARPGEGSFAASGTCVATGPGGLGWFATGASGVDTRVIRTADYGETWSEAVTPVRSAAPDEGLTSLAFFDARRGAAFGGLALDSAVNVTVTEDGGATWRAAARGVLGGTVYGSSTVPGTPTPTLVAVSPSGSAWSADFGRSWTAFDTLEHWTVDFVHAGAGWAAGRGIISRIDGRR